MTTSSMEPIQPSSLEPSSGGQRALVDRVAREVESYVRVRFAVPADDRVFTRTVDLFEEGYVDSTGLVELIAHVEQQYAIRLPEEALFDASFSHIDGIARVVAGLIVP
jgi:acyl carrier protein